jgi:hypothetical protein
MSIPQGWDPRDYRLKVWEDRPIRWPVGKIVSRGLKEITPGDAIILFFVKTGKDYPGIYGWGVIDKYNEQRNEIVFQVTPSSDYLKTDPIGDEDVEKLIDRIRGKGKQGTLWGISRDEFSILCNKVRERIGFGVV